MGQIEIFRVGRIPVYVDFLFVVIAALWSWPYWTGGDLQYMSAGFVLVIGIFASVLLHELGHAWAGRLFKVETRAIEINGLGGLCYFERSLPTSVLARTVINLAGPFANLVLWKAFGFAADASGSAGGGLPWMVMTTLATANFLLLVFNLLPAFPLDGGRVLETWLAPLFGPAWSVRIVSVLGLVVAAGIVYLAFPSQIFMVMLAALLAMQNWQMLQSVGGFGRR
jgi:Zn-dependent protease